MSEEDIRQLYRKGEDAMVAFVMDLLRQLHTNKEQDCYFHLILPSNSAIILTIFPRDF